MSASNIYPRLPVIAFLGLLFATFTLAKAQEQDTNYYEIESLNSGLEAVPDVVIRETPRDTLESFLDLATQGDYKSAAHLLNLNEIDKASQAAHGPELARMLFEVIDRRVVIDWQDVPSRPDAVNENFPKDHPFAGTARPSLSIASLSIRNRPALIRLNRVKPPESEAVWVFSGQTVGLIPALDRAYGPSWFEDLLPPALSTKFYSGIRIWELIGLPLLLALSVGLAFLQHKLFRALSTRAQVQWIRRASDQVATPLAVASTAVIMMFMTSYVLTFSGAVTVVLEPLLWALVIFGFTFAALNTIDATLEVVTDRYVGEISSSRDSDRRHLYTNIYALRRYVLLAAFLTSTVLLLHKLQVFQSLGWSILASAGVATVILGIAGQSVLGNILASLQIAIAKPIRIGDNVVYEDRWAYVESIYYTFVVLRTWDERRLIVPVKHFASNTFENLTIIDAKCVRSFTLKLDHSAEPAVLRELYENLVREDEDALPEETLLVIVEESSEYSQTIGFYATAENPGAAWLMQARLSEKVGEWIRQNRPDWWSRIRLDRMHVDAHADHPEASARNVPSGKFKKF